MAIWQVKIELVPLDWAEKNIFDAESLYDSEGMYDTSYAWKNNQPHIDFERMIRTILPAKESWNEELNIWGKSKNDDIQVWREQGLVESIGFRIDLRKDPTKITKELLSFANEIKCTLFFPEQKIIVKPEASITIQIIRNSGAAKFVSAPHAYLNSINNTYKPL